MPKPDCSQCPSFMARETAIVDLKTDPGGPVCKRFGHVLSRPSLDPSHEIVVMQTFAGKCSEFGNPLPMLTQNVPKAQVALPNSDVLALGRSLEATRPTNCAECKHLAASRLVLEELSWGLPLCTATGRLVFPGFITQTASECQYGVQGASEIDTLEGVDLLPIYDEAFNAVEAVKTGMVAFTAPDAFIDPREYPTDKPLTSQDERDGLMAWREIKDPSGYGEPVFWPVFDPEFIKQDDPLEYAKIPFAGSPTSPELYVDWQGFLYQTAAILVSLGKTPMSVGAAGTGKTEEGIVMAYLGNMPMDRISVTAGMNLGDFLGELRFVKNETVFRAGRFPRRYGRRGVCILDEINAGEDELLQAIRSAFDGSGMVSLEGAAVQHPETGEWIVPEPIRQHDYNATILCINPASDYINTGVRELSDADRSRFMMLRFEQPPEHIEREILTRHYTRDGHAPPSPKLLDAVCAIGRDLRGLIAEGALEGMTWGMRSQILAINATKCFPIVTAYMRAGGDYFEAEKRIIIETAVNSHTEGQNIR